MSENYALNNDGLEISVLIPSFKDKTIIELSMFQVLILIVGD